MSNILVAGAKVAPPLLKRVFNVYGIIRHWYISVFYTVIFNINKIMVTFLIVTNIFDAVNNIAICYPMLRSLRVR